MVSGSGIQRIEIITPLPSALAPAMNVLSSINFSLGAGTSPYFSNPTPPPPLREPPGPRMWPDCSPAELFRNEARSLEVEDSSSQWAYHFRLAPTQAGVGGGTLACGALVWRRYLCRSTRDYMNRTSDLSMMIPTHSFYCEVYVIGVKKLLEIDDFK